jgi:hypothetical protein
MSNNSLPIDQHSVRGTDTNSLLRLYDMATDILRTAALQEERVRAQRALQRITKELEKRNVRL